MQVIINSKNVSAIKHITHIICYISVCATHKIELFSTGVTFLTKGWCAKSVYISNNMTGLAFYERSLAEKKEKFLPSFSS